MFELLFGIGACVVMGKVADHENQSPVIWSGVTVALCGAAVLLIPWPYLRFLIAFGAAFIAMTAYKVATRS